MCVGVSVCVYGVCVGVSVCVWEWLCVCGSECVRVGGGGGKCVREVSV